MKRNDKGFTMIELILVISLLGILAVVALPRFFNMSTQARQSARDGIVGSVRSGIALWRANDLVTGGPGNYPATLDGVANGACASCFTTVLDQGITDGRWTKAGLVYTYNDGTGTTDYTYNPATGAFQ